MRYLSFFSVGIFFGFVLYKSEAASWYRIYEMFQFASFHMYGIIGSALAVGILGVQILKRKKVQSLDGEPLSLNPKQKSFPRYAIGGTLFGLGWALAGACPGPMYILVGAGFIPILIVIFGALLGTFIYGVLRDKLPH